MESIYDAIGSSRGHQVSHCKLDLNIWQQQLASDCQWHSPIVHGFSTHKSAHTSKQTENRPGMLNWTPIDRSLIDSSQKLPIFLHLYTNWIGLSANNVVHAFISSKLAKRQNQIGLNNIKFVWWLAKAIGNWLL